MRSLKKVQEAETEFYDRVWFDRRYVNKLEEDIKKYSKMMIEKYGEDIVKPNNDFERGMLNGKLSALRWVLGSDWDFLDT